MLRKPQIFADPNINFFRPLFLILVAFVNGVNFIGTQMVLGELEGLLTHLEQKSHFWQPHHAITVQTATKTRCSH